MRQRKKFILFTSFVVVAVSVFCASVMKKTQKQTLTVTDAEGITYVAIIDQNSEVYAGITDADGNMYAAKIDNGVVLKDSPMYIVDNYDGTFPFNDTTRTDDININLNNDNNIEFGGEVVIKTTSASQPSDEDVKTTVSESGTPSESITDSQNSENTEPGNDATTVAATGSEETTENTEAVSVESETSESESQSVNGESDSTTSAPGHEITGEKMAEKYIKLFNSGIFAMTFTTDDPDLKEDITMAMRNGSIYMDTSMEGLSCKVLFDSNKNTGYIIIPQMRVYCALPEDLASDLSGTEFAMPEISEALSSKAYDVEIDGKDCVCEEYEFENSTRYFYFYNGNLVRMIDMSDGEATVYNIKTLTSDVDSSYFELPKGYLKVDLSWLQTQDIEG